MRRTQLETFRQSRVIVVVDVVVVTAVVFAGAYFPVTSNRALQLRGSMPRDDVRPMNPVVTHSHPLLAVAGTGAGEGRASLGDALPPLGVDAPLDKGSFTSPGKGSAGAIRVARLLLTLCSDVTATDDEAMKVFLTSASSFAIPNV